MTNQASNQTTTAGTMAEKNICILEEQLIVLLDIQKQAVDSQHIVDASRGVRKLVADIVCYSTVESLLDTVKPSVLIKKLNDQLPILVHVQSNLIDIAQKIELTKEIRTAISDIEQRKCVIAEKLRLMKKTSN